MNSILKGIIATALVLAGASVHAASGEKPLKIDYQPAPPAPASQMQAEADAKSEGCVSCHSASESKTMHRLEAVVLGCTDCHGGDANVFKVGNFAPDSVPYLDLLSKAHVMPTLPESWNWPDSNSPEHTYTLVNHESPEFIRFVNPGDYRVAREACGACHLPVIETAERSLMANTAMFWQGAAYNNGILPFKRAILGEAYTHHGEAATLKGPVTPDENMIAKGVIDTLYPLPAWETIEPADVFRVFERGGRNIVNLFPDTGLPNVATLQPGTIQRLEEPGRPDLKQSNRGPGTGNRIAVPVLNMHKTRLNNPLMWFLGTNEQPGDYRSSGCSACHVIYANDRDPRHSGPYAQHGHTGQSATADPTIPNDRSGHPIEHVFTSAIPTSQCMTCHMHQPNIFLNSMLGYTMWDYESDAPAMWPEEQQYPTDEDFARINERNPEEAAVRGKWSDPEFLKQVSELNPTLNDTQFADYHGHGWNFRAIHKRDRKGNLLDAKGNIVANDDPEKFEKAVHMSSTHVDVGMHCTDCHFSQDMHGDGHMYGEVAQAIEIECVDCHGTADEYPPLLTSGPAAPEGGTDLSTMRTPFGDRRFEWRGGELIQRSSVTPGLEWSMSLVKDSVNPGSSHYNEKSAQAKTVSSNTETQNFGPDVAVADRAHQDDKMLCVTCHTSWTTSCGGCHLPIEANRLSDRLNYEGGTTRNLATYNPQVARDDVFQLGMHGPAKGGRIAPVRSSSALVLSSTNANREKIYIQQPPIAASGYSSQAFAPHYPHTERKTETKQCDDCHLSRKNDNNAILAQLLLHGTNFMNFIGYNAWLGLEGQIAGVNVTEWDEPQAVIGSYLHRYAYPDWHAEHVARGRTLTKSERHSTGGDVGCLQLRGEYLYVAQGGRGFEAYDVASIANKGFSQKLISAPFSPLGHRTRVTSKNATCVALPTNQPIHPDRNTEYHQTVNQEQPFHPVYNYALITDSEEGLILVDVNTLSDGELRNNTLQRALTWNPDGLLTGARHLTVAGRWVYITTPRGIVVADLDDPMKPQVITTINVADARSTAVQFRYLFVTSAHGLEVVDITNPETPRIVDGAQVKLDDARRVYVVRTYAYVAAGKEGLVIIDVENPEAPRLYQRFTADGAINDASDVKVAATNASLFAYVADGVNGLRVIQLMSPETQPNFYGFSPEPKPQLIASHATDKPARAVSEGLHRDRAVDESGGQIAVFGRIGSRPFTLDEQRKLYVDDEGKPWFVRDRR
ncbi:hypothetical protein [Polycyclovorans algicola]|uniref:hypothetical protein n=1 Tax=Polycyclovorans algicola TaxID=616992 RepID=UPI0004A74062|nr:hypothetical protein [Polycyclovorans algicola]